MQWTHPCILSRGSFILHYNQTNSHKQSVIFLQRSLWFLSLSLSAALFFPINLHLCLFLCLYQPVWSFFLFSVIQKMELYRMTYKCREFYCTKNAEPCAPPVFVRGNCRSQGFGIVTTTEQDPNTVGRWRQKKKITWLLQDVTEKEKKLVPSTCLLHFWKSWHPNICIDAACMFSFLFCSCCCVVVFFKAYCSNGQQLCRSFAAALVHLMRSCLESECVFCFCFFQIEVCVCVCVCASHEAPCRCIEQSSRLRTSHFQQPQVTEAIDPQHQGIDWLSGNKWNMHRLS